MFQTIGKYVLAFFTEMGKITIFTRILLLRLFQLRIKWRLVFEQMNGLGINSLPIVIMTAAFVSMAFTIQVVREFLKFGAQSMIGGIVGMAVWRELGPIMTGAVVAGRVGAAIAAEIGSMKVTEQVDGLEALSQDPMVHLVLPRVIATTLMMPILVGIADVVGFLSGFLITLNTGRINPYSYFHSAQTMLQISDVTGGLIKGVLFGFAIGIIGAYTGLNTTSGAKGVGKTTKLAVVASLIVVFGINYFMSLVLFK
jgi:phospholipid/cholesterol/gamma-HCH transport system permease protein